MDYYEVQLEVVYVYFFFLPPMDRTVEREKHVMGKQSSGNDGSMTQLS